METLKFVVVTIAVSNIIAFGLNWIEYFVLRSPLFLYVFFAVHERNNLTTSNSSYGMWYHGQMALQIGVLVAFTQLIPEHHVQLFGVLKARVKVRKLSEVG